MLENRQEHFRNKAGFKPAAWELVTTLPAVTQTLTVQLAIGEKLNEMRLSATSYLEIVLHPTHKNNVQQWKQKWSKWNWKPMKTMTLWLIKRISRKDAREKKQQKLVLTFFFFKFVLQVAITEWVNKWNEGKEHVFTSPSYETYWCFNWTNKKKSSFQQPDLNQRHKDANFASTVLRFTNWAIKRTQRQAFVFLLFFHLKQEENNLRNAFSENSNEWSKDKNKKYYVITMQK